MKIHLHKMNASNSKRHLEVLVCALSGLICFPIRLTEYYPEVLESRLQKILLMFHEFHSRNNEDKANWLYAGDHRSPTRLNQEKE